jgi:hypothetical protein
MKSGTKKWLPLAISVVLFAVLANGDVPGTGNPTLVVASGTNNLAGSTLINQHAAVSTGSTLTIPACGSGTFQYVTYIEVDTACNGSLAAAATSTTTTTNLGGIQWVQSVPATAGSMAPPIVINSTIKSQAANTASTIVLPAVTNCFTNANVAYYCDP